MPKVSVIMPTYNRADCLSRAIDSVLHQTLDDLELLIIDDGSTDNTPGVVKSHSDNRLTYIQSETNHGAQWARNKGISEAMGDYISFLDSDDVFKPGHLEKCLSILESSPEDVGGVCTSYEYVKEGVVIGQTRLEDGELPEEDIYMNNIGGFSCYTVRGSVFEDVGLLDEDFPSSQDMEFMIRLSDYYGILSTSDILVEYAVDGARIDDDMCARARGQQLILEKFGDRLSPRHKALVLHQIGKARSQDSLREARSHFLRALKHDPTRIGSHFHLMATLFGREGYKRLIDLGEAIV